MRTQIALGSTVQVKLKHAILVYSQDHSTSFATVHDVVSASDEGAPFLGPGSLLTKRFVQDLARSLREEMRPEILPENVLCRTPELLVWWTQAQIRTMFFRQGSELAAFNARKFPQPPLVFRVEDQALSVRALKENQRPDARTKLWNAPYWNTSAAGLVCQGSMAKPGETTIDSMGHWETAFFQSEFTHTTGGYHLTAHPNGSAGLWTDMAGQKEFAVKYLAPAKQTMEEFVGKS